MAKLNDLTNKTFGAWEVLYRNGSTPNKASIWHCRCTTCGAEKDIVGQSLTSGSSTMCRKCSAKLCQHHKYTNNPVKISLWNGMKSRCYDKSHPRFKDYGGRGITICDEWLNNYELFCDWAYANGYKKGMSIERIDCNKGYSPDNCKFIPLSEQNRNRRNSIMITIGEETKCLQEWCNFLIFQETRFVGNTIRACLGTMQYCAL